MIELKIICTVYLILALSFYFTVLSFLSKIEEEVVKGKSKYFIIVYTIVFRTSVLILWPYILWRARKCQKR